MNISKIGFNVPAGSNAEKTLANMKLDQARKVVDDVPSWRVPTYELKIAAEKSNKNAFAKAADKALGFLKANKKAFAIGAGVVAGLATVGLIAKKVIDNKNQK